MKKVSIGAVLVAMAAIGLGVSAFANSRGNDGEDRGRRFNAELLPDEEVPSVSSTGSGDFVAWLNDAGNLEYRLRYENLEGTPIIQSHIHLGQHTANGGVSVFLCAGDKPACPQVTPLTPEGVVEGEIGPANVVGPTAQGIAAGEFAELVRAMRAGLAYVNVHSGKHPGGEIRGQIKVHDRGAATGAISR